MSLATPLRSTGKAGWRSHLLTPLLFVAACIGLYYFISVDGITQGALQILLVVCMIMAAGRAPTANARGVALAASLIILCLGNEFAGLYFNLTAGAIVIFTLFVARSSVDWRAATIWQLIGVIFGCMIGTISGLGQSEPEPVLNTIGALIQFTLLPILIVPFFRLCRLEPRQVVALQLLATFVAIAFVAIGTFYGTSASEDKTTGLSFVSYYQIGQRVLYLNRTFTGPHLSVGACACLGLLLSRVDVKIKLLAFIGFVWSFATLFSLGSRAAMIAVVVVAIILLIIALTTPKGFSRVGGTLFLLLIAGLIGVTVFAETVQNVAVARLTGSTDAAWSSGERLLFQQHAIEWILANPQGMGWSMSIPGHFFFQFGILNNEHPHNDYLTVLMSFGWMGGLAFAWLYFGTLVRLLRQARPTFNAPQGPAVFAGLGAAFALIVGAFTDHLASRGPLFVVSWMVVGLGASVAYDPIAKSARARFSRTRL